MWNRKRVSRSGTETKVQFRYRYCSWNSFFSSFFSTLGDISLLIWKAWNWTLNYKNMYSKTFNISMSVNLALGALLWWKKNSILSVTRFLTLKSVVSVWARKYWLFWVWVAVSDLNQSSGFKSFNYALMFRSSHFWYLVFGHFCRRSYENIT